MKFVRAATMAGLALASAAPVHASEFDDTLAAAQAGDYQAQRNVAYMLEHGDGVEANPTEGCAWRFVILATQGARVQLTDTMIDDRCGPPALRQSATARTQALLSALPKRDRTVDADVAAITEDECPGADCTGPLKSLADNYRRALKGDVKAIRAVADCFATGCGRSWGVDLFKACLWATKAASTPRSTAQDKALAHNTCGALGQIGAAAVRPHLAMLFALRRMPASRR